MMQRYLFDRLTKPLAHQPNEEQGRINWLRHAITEELQRLFSQRSFFAGMTSSNVASSQPSILNFGLSDLASQSANFEGTGVIAEQIKQMVLHYEPRLQLPEISLVASDSPTQAATVKISGIISADSITEAFVWQSSNANEELAE